MNRAVIGLGSNIDPDTNIAMAKIRMSEQFQFLAESPIVETSPVGNTEQPNFKNGTVLLETSLSRAGVTKILKDIEIGLGRKPGGERNGPRTIDLDMVVWNESVVDPDFYTRDFLHNAVLAVLPEFKGS